MIPPATSPEPEIWIGLDTGGTYTDAVALDGQRQVVASAKALTTHWDLSVGLGAAMRAVLAALPQGAQREHISLVSVSTTLATNAVVENRFSPICTILIGFDEPMVERSGLRRIAGGVVVRVRGGHEATGEEHQPLDESGVDAAVREFGAQVEAFAVASMFSVRNPAHERKARERIRALSDRPVTCSHELSSQLDAPKRALTAALNARLTPQIAHLLDALRQVLEREAITAPVMIVKGDGTLMRAEVALEYPVETVLSGPAASVVGAGFLSGQEDFAVADMGGTTTDVAIVAGGRPVVRTEGAVVGGWRTMVEAIDARTCGLGGDSEVHFDRERRLCVGPRRVLPLSLLAVQFPEALTELRKLAAREHLPAFAAQFAFRNPGRDPGRLDRIEQRVWDALASSPRPLDVVARTAQGVEAVRRLIDRGLATLAGFTPTDALHVLARQHGWSLEAARIGAAVLATEERNATGPSERDTPEALCERTYQHVVREGARFLLESVLAQDPGIEARQGRWGPLGILIERLVAGRPFSGLIDSHIRLATPLIAIGAPAGSYYPEVARRLGARLFVPEHAAVCNAVGAVAGVVCETSEVLVNQTEFEVFRVHDPAGSRDYHDAREAIEHAKRVSRELAFAAAQRAGASDPHVETFVIERRARSATEDYLAEASVRSRATGRPATGRAPQVAPRAAHR
ncbi:MAG TPA: hydantoinase/oxoprolinase family protein [Steroidobacteraceae bacterium]|jgi:N-methylhydantoinase A/oxoprolinase/acetone carboxylase beta subunit|nr:hydantoinase/oxoprolinase family protein [Steroidobacteraceae bacterium]